MTAYMNMNTTATNLISGVSTTYSIGAIVPLVLLAGCILAIVIVAISSSTLITFINKVRKILQVFIYAATGYIITYCGQLIYAIGETLGRLGGNISLYDIANFGAMILLGYISIKIGTRIWKNITEAYPKTIEDIEKGLTPEKT